MKERTAIVECVRSEIVGPSRNSAPAIAGFSDREFRDPVARRKGALAWKPGAGDELEEVLYFDRESPNRKYGAGMLHPIDISPSEADLAANATDTLGVDVAEDESLDSSGDTEDKNELLSGADDDDFEVSGGSVRRPATMGISFCVSLQPDGYLEILLPSKHRFAWQAPDELPFPVNGRYERCHRRWTDDRGKERRDPIWRRRPCLGSGTSVRFLAHELEAGRPVRKSIVLPPDAPIRLVVDCFPREIKGQSGEWLVTVVLRNVTPIEEGAEERELVLYQAFFEAVARGGRLLPYPESTMPFGSLDADEKSLSLLYRDSATYGIGHGCAAAWDCASGETPESVQADVMPTVELPSMTPDVVLGANPLRLGMRQLAELSDDATGSAWDSLRAVRDGYAEWIENRRREIPSLPTKLRETAFSHLDLCQECLARIEDGLALLLSSKPDRDAFRLANLAMLLQQIATKQLQKRTAVWDQSIEAARIQGQHISPWSVFDDRTEDAARIGSWRAFQIAFLLMSLRGLVDPPSPDRETVDLIWFPTGGGKTEAYLAAMAFYMFRERLKMREGDPLARDGTNVLMRYTLRMLTTQQFQRAASLVCAMEEIRRNPSRSGVQIPGTRFSLGLWIGGEASPNRCDQARTDVNKYLKGYVGGNPLVLTDCPWCRAPIGKLDTSGRNKKSSTLLGISNSGAEGPRLLCPDHNCAFGVEDHRRWLPVEVIDERIYRNPPSLLISTADKFAMLAYRPEAGALFGRKQSSEGVEQIATPPGLIVQDELHLISGPLGTMYALYESVFEQLCTVGAPDGSITRPKIIASTATIRGADDQVRSLYARERTRLFPSPGLSMGDSFFGRYARADDGELRSGRLYVGVHAIDHGSILTTQVRTFSAALYRPAAFDQDSRDPWWTLLAFYNSIRELGGARTLFDSDIRSRLKFLFNREGVDDAMRRNLRVVDELTSRLSQPEIVAMMDRLSRAYRPPAGEGTFDACLASNIIEVGVDIDRLSLMGVVGQPKTTSTYIQVTGRVGRRWQDRPGLILTIYNPSKSRDRSHFEQFHAYHRRLYERVEPTSATPFAASAIQRGSAGAALAWIRQQVNQPVQDFAAHEHAMRDAFALLASRCELVVAHQNDRDRSLAELQRAEAELERKWKHRPQKWEQFPQSPTGEYLMLWPGQFATVLQDMRGVKVPTSMRQVDGTGELTITPGYGLTSGGSGAPASALATGAK